MPSIQSEAFLLVKKGKSNLAFDRRHIRINSPQRKEVLIETEAFGLNYADVMARLGLYRDAPPLPTILGYEVVGHIVALGEDVNRELLGKRVVAFCRFGGYSRHVICKSDALAEIHDSPANEALALCTQAVTAFYMSEYQSSIHRGNRVLIHAAAGGVGSILIQLAKQRGAEVYAKIGDDSKMELVTKLGADHIINYKSVNYQHEVHSLLHGNSLDISFNPVGGSTFKKDMKLLGAGGKIFLYGGSELSVGQWGLLSQVNFLRKMGMILPIGLTMSSKSVLGINMLKIADYHPEILAYCLNQVVKLYFEGKLTPVIGGNFSSDELAMAHEALERGKTIGKLSVFWEK